MTTPGRGVWGGGGGGEVRRVKTPLGSKGYPKGGGGGGGGVRRGATPEPAPVEDPSTALIGEWLDFSGKLRIEKPDLWVELWDYLHKTGQFNQTEYLRAHPNLMQFIQSLGQNFGRILAGFQAWEDAVIAERET